MNTKHRAHLLFDSDLYAALLHAARAEDRTFAAEIRKRLRESLRQEVRGAKRRTGIAAPTEDHA